MSGTSFSILYTFTDPAQAALMETAMRYYLWNQELNEQAWEITAKRLDAPGVDARPLLKDPPGYFFSLKKRLHLMSLASFWMAIAARFMGPSWLRSFFDCFKPEALSSITAVIYHDLGGTYRFLCYDGEHRIIIGHVSTAIITKSGLISADPTYFGSKAGQIIPKYENKKASIIKIKDML